MCILTAAEHFCYVHREKRGLNGWKFVNLKVLCDTGTYCPSWHCRLKGEMKADSMSSHLSSHLSLLEQTWWLYPILMAIRIHRLRIVRYMCTVIRLHMIRIDYGILRIWYGVDVIQIRQPQSHTHRHSHTFLPFRHCGEKSHSRFKVLVIPTPSPAAFTVIYAYLLFYPTSKSCPNPLFSVPLLPLLHYDIITTWRTHLSSFKPAPVYIPPASSSRTDFQVQRRL